jgi:hypothetical protein
MVMLSSNEAKKERFRKGFEKIRQELDDTSFLKRIWGSKWQHYIADRIEQWAGNDVTLDVFLSLYRDELNVDQLENAIANLQKMAHTIQQQHEWTQRVKSLSKWMGAADCSAIFEIIILHSLLNLVGETCFQLYPEVAIGNSPSTVDASIVIDNREIFIEISAHNTRKYDGPGAGYLSDLLGLPFATAIRKKKYESRQLGLISDKPNVFIYSGCGSPQRRVNENSIPKCFADARSQVLSAIILCSAYYLPKGAIYINPDAVEPVKLTEKEAAFFKSNFEAPIE